jgi:uncharacterized protein (TIGR00299 family) protein
MKLLYLDCSMGAAGDMLSAALLSLLPDPDAFVARLNHLGLPGVRFTKEPSVKCGVTGTHLSVTVDGAEEDEPHEGHHHRDLADIGALAAALPEAARGDVLDVYRLIAEAEGRVHGRPSAEVHFHEVGALDALADISAFCLLVQEIAPDKIIASPVRTGFGQVKCAHGLLPVPAPAAAELLKGIPIYAGAIEGELCTPTGAALLKKFCASFGPMPVLQTEKIGYGMGKKDFAAPNCVRAFLGQTPGEPDGVWELRCNLDDMTPEGIAFAMERLFEAGALDAYTVPVGMKKSRPGVLLVALCRDADKAALVSALFRHTTTLGVRELPCRRDTLRRAELVRATSFGPIRVKRSEGFGVVREKYEYEDLAKIARERDLSLEEVLRKLGSQET